MFIIYRKGEVLNQIVAWGADRERKIEGKSLARLAISGSNMPLRARGGSHIGWSD